MAAWRGRRSSFALEVTECVRGAAACGTLNTRHDHAHHAVGLCSLVQQTRRAGGDAGDHGRALPLHVEAVSCDSSDVHAQIAVLVSPKVLALDREQRAARACALRWFQRRRQLQITISGLWMAGALATGSAQSADLSGSASSGGKRLFS